MLISVLTREAETERMQIWLGGQTPGSLRISDWVTTEFSSALSIKLRHGKIDLAQRADCLKSFGRLARESFVAFAVSGTDFRLAARFADQYGLGLRAGDSLHLAVCAEHGATLCTLDRRLAAAGDATGVKTALL